MKSNPKVGFVGLGVMGKPMAHNLLKAGFELTVHNRSQAAVDELAEAGAARASSPAGCASGADAVITMLPDGPDVESVMLGILEGARAGTILIDMSTISPVT